MPQDSLDREEEVKGPPESGVDFTEQLRQLHLAKEEDTPDIQLQSDIDRSAKDLERLVIIPDTLPRGKRDEVDGLIPRMMRHGGVIQRDGQVPKSSPYPGSHPYQRPSQQRSSQSQQQPWEHLQQQQQQQVVQHYIPGPQVVTRDIYRIYGDTRPGSAQIVQQQNLHPVMRAMNPGTQEPRQTPPPHYPGGRQETRETPPPHYPRGRQETRETSPPHYPGGRQETRETPPRYLGGTQEAHETPPPHYPTGRGVMTGTPSRLDIPNIPLELSETEKEDLEDILTVLRQDLETDGASMPRVSIPNVEPTVDKSGSMFKSGQSVWAQTTSRSSGRSSPAQVVPSNDILPTLSSCSTSSEVWCRFDGSGSLPYPHCSDRQTNQHTVLQNNSSAYPPTWSHPSADHSAFPSSGLCVTANSPAYPPSGPYDIDSPLDLDLVKAASFSQQPFMCLPDQNGSKQIGFTPDLNKASRGGAPVFPPDQEKTPCGEAQMIRPPPDMFLTDQEKTPCGEAQMIRPPPEILSGVPNNSACGQGGRCTNAGEAPGGSPCSSTSSHHSPNGPSPSCSEYSDDDDDEEEEEMCHEEDTVVHYFADLDLQQVEEIYRDNKQLVVNNVNKLNYQRQTALYIAVMLRKYDIVYFLLRIRADPNIQCVERKGDTMQAPLHKAIELGDTQMVLLLLAHEGLDIELQRVCDKKTPLMLALHGHILDNEERNRREIIHHLLDYGACIDKFNESSDKTILMMAIETRDVCLIEHFLDRVGVEKSRDLINRANKVGNTSLHIAAGMRMRDRGEHLHLLTMLIHFGGNTDAANQDLKTPKDWKRNLFDEIKKQHLTYRSRY